jgi:hypothetical protein
MKSTRTFLALLALSATVALAGCSCNPACQFRGTINQPENLSMRRSMLRKGMGDFCKQMTTRNAPLKLAPESPVIGRYYPNQCQAAEGDGVLNVKFAGYGYVWTNVTKKMTFTGGGAAAYKYDFRVTEGDVCDIYAWFRPARIEGSDFKVHRIEGTMASVFNSFSQFGDNFGRSLVSKKLQEGFTVISRDGKEENVDFALGIVPLGQKPFHPYQVERNDGKITYENERTEVHQNQRDFVGPISIEDSGRSLFISANVDGVPAIDVMLMRKADAEASLQLYFEYPQSGPLAAAPIQSEVLQTGVELKRRIPVPPGMYYVVFDNTPTAGNVAPPVNPLDDRAAVVNYLIQIGDST